MSDLNEGSGLKHVVLFTMIENQPHFIKSVPNPTNPALKDYKLFAGIKDAQLFKPGQAQTFINQLPATYPYKLMVQAAK